MKIRDLQINEIDRRGFLKGLGAAAVAGATGSALAAPFKHGEYKDQMTGDSQGRYSKVRSDNKNATLEISWPDSKVPMTVIEIPGATINFGVYGASGRIKIGNGPVQEFGLSQGNSGNYSWGANLNKSIVKQLLKHNGEVKIEVPLFRTGAEVFKFTLEQDSTTAQIKAPADAPKNSARDTQNDIRRDNLKRLSGDTGAGNYANRIIARIKPNITFSGQIKGNPVTTVEVKAGNDGTIISRRITNSSGNSEWDNAVLKAIDRTAVLPKDSDGQVPPTLQINFRPKD